MTDGEDQNIDYLYPTKIYEQYYRLGTENPELNENKIYKYGNIWFPDTSGRYDQINYGEGYKRKALVSFKRGQNYYIITNDYYMLINKELEQYNDSKIYYVLEDNKYINAKDLAISIYNKRKNSAIPEDIQIEIANRTGLICDLTILKNNNKLVFIGFDNYRSLYKQMNTMSPYNYYDWGFFNLCYSKSDFPTEGNYPLYQLNNDYEFEIVNKDIWESNKTQYWTNLNNLVFESNKYYTKEKQEWQDSNGNIQKLKIYLTDQFNPETYWTTYLSNPEKLIFWIDFIDTTYGGDLAQYGVQQIGDRPKTVNDDKIKAIYYRDTPPVVFKDETDNIEEIIEAAQEGSYSYINITNNIENLFSISSQTKSAFDELNSLLYNYSYCSEQITLTSIPIYYLEPNARILVNDTNSNIQGEYLISKLTIPLTYNGTMSIVATKAVNRIY